MFADVRRRSSLWPEHGLRLEQVRRVNDGVLLRPMSTKVAAIRLVSSSAALCFLLAHTPASAQVDPATARAHLVQGAELRQQGKCAEAIPHFVESLRLDPSARTEINLADCDERVGKLVDAQHHWLEARDRAAAEGQEAIRQEAERRLGALEPRMPRLTLRLADGAPADAKVLRDGVEVARVSLGMEVAVDPGRHELAVRANGHQDKVEVVTLEEKDKKDLTLDAGAPATAAPVGPSPSPPALSAGGTGSPGGPSGPSGERAAAPESKGMGTQRILALASAGIGVAGLGAGSVMGVLALSKWNGAKTGCSSDGTCSTTVLPDAQTARSDATASTVLFVVGAVALAAGAALWFTSPSAPGGAALLVAPTVTPGGGGFEAVGMF
jgi:hypothetical protein